MMTVRAEIMDKFNRMRMEKNISILKNLVREDWEYENDPVFKTSKENTEMVFSIFLENEKEMADALGISHSILKKLREEIRK